MAIAQIQRLDQACTVLGRGECKHVSMLTSVVVQLHDKQTCRSDAPSHQKNSFYKDGLLQVHSQHTAVRNLIRL